MSGLEAGRDDSISPLVLVLSPLQSDWLKPRRSGYGHVDHEWLIENVVRCKSGTPRVESIDRLVVARVLDG